MCSQPESQNFWWGQESFLGQITFWGSNGLRYYVYYIMIAVKLPVCYFRLRRLRQLRDVVTDNVMKQLVMLLVFGRLDYCNCSRRASASRIHCGKLQRLQSAAVWLALGLNRRARIKPVLHRLHWLAVNWIQDSHPDEHRSSPTCCTISEWHHNSLNSTESGRHQLRSSMTNAAVVMRTQT